MNAPRPLHVIAADIRVRWFQVDMAAVPHLDAMAELDKTTDPWGAGSASDVVIDFLQAAHRTFTGQDAERIKAELRGMLK